MATITLTIPDAALPRIVDGVCTRFNFDLNKIGAETKGQFTKRIMIQNLKQWVKTAENDAINLTARAQQVTNETDIEANIAIT